MTDRKRAATFVGIVAALLVVVGGIGLFSEVTTTGATGKVVCGSAISPDNKQAERDGRVESLSEAMAGTPASRIGDYANSNTAACEKAISGQRSWTWPLFGFGIVGLFGSVFLGTNRAAPMSQSAEKEDAV